MNVTFIEETVIDERAIRRLASNKSCKVTRENGLWDCCGVSMDDDEVWEVLASK